MPAGDAVDTYLANKDPRHRKFVRQATRPKPREKNDGPLNFLKRAYNAVDKYGDDRWEEIRHPRRVDARKNREAGGKGHKQSLAVSQGKLASILEQGGAHIWSQRAGLGEIVDMFKGTKDIPQFGPHGRVYDLTPKINSKKPPGGFGGSWAHRIPFVTEKAGKGRVYHGGQEDEHADLYRVMKGLRWDPGDPKVYRDDWYQGFLSKPFDDDWMHLDLAYGPEWGEAAPKNLRGLEKLIKHLLRDHPDEGIAPTNKLVSAIRPHSPRNSADMARLMARLRGIER